MEMQTLLMLEPCSVKKRKLGPFQHSVPFLKIERWSIGVKRTAFLINIQSVTMYHSPSSLEILWLSGSLALCHILAGSTAHQLWIFFACIVWS